MVDARSNHQVFLLSGISSLACDKQEKVTSVWMWTIDKQQTDRPPRKGNLMLEIQFHVDQRENKKKTTQPEKLVK